MVGSLTFENRSCLHWEMYQNILTNNIQLKFKIRTTEFYVITGVFYSAEWFFWIQNHPIFHFDLSMHLVLMVQNKSTCMSQFLEIRECLCLDLFPWYCTNCLEATYMYVICEYTRSRSFWPLQVILRFTGIIIIGVKLI